ncbi:MAG: hypothetical protein ISR51_06000 [Rhodospirillales bacterium]|nr:hypothetical protein [Alphaproteobacteria bacterium]MBL6948211.1 hypothetical protein [Rhodospirillales bacterium]
MRSLFIACVLFIAFHAFTPPAFGAPVHEFNKAVATAYGFYREAVFLLRAGNAQVASLELEEMADQWKDIAERFGTKPPDTFSDDVSFKKTLDDIGKRISKGLKAAIKGDAKAARKALAPIRNTLADLRRRNGVFVYSDYVDKANAAFRKLYKFRHNPPDFEVVEEVDQLRQILAITVYWYEQCADNAPEEVRKNPEFKRLMEDSLHSLSRIWVAIANKASPNLISLLRGLSSSDRMLFLRFG